MKTIRFIRNKCHRGRDFGPDLPEDTVDVEDHEARYYVRRGSAVYEDGSTPRVEHRDPVVENRDPEVAVNPLDGISRPKLLKLAEGKGVEIEGSGKNGYVTADDARKALAAAGYGG